MPSWIVMLLVYIYVALASYNTGYLTLGMESIETIIDDAANVAVIDCKGRMRSGIEMQRAAAAGGKKVKSGAGGSVEEWKSAWSQGTDAVMDVPLGGVCEVLYGESRQEWEDDDSD